MLLSEAALDEAANSCSEFEVELQLLQCANSCVRRGFQATVYIDCIMQNVVIDTIQGKVMMYFQWIKGSLFHGSLFLQDSLSTGEKASVQCRFLHHPEFLRVGSRVVMREGPMKAVGQVSKLHPHLSTNHSGLLF